MATPYSKIYEAATFKFMDYDFLKLNEDERSEILKRYLKSSVSDFIDICKTDLSLYSELTDSFDEDLSEGEIEILASGIAYYWVKARTLNIELLRNELSTKDWTYFSPANLAREVNALRESYKKEYYQAIKLYSYRNGDIQNLAP